MVFYRDRSFDGVLLLPEQKQLLALLVEAARRVPRERREKIGIIHTMASPLGLVLHEGWPDREPSVYDGDLDALVNEGMLTVTSDGRVRWFDVTPRGFKYYEHLQMTKGAPVTRIEATARSYIDADNFAKRYADSYARWLDAEERLWGADAPSQLTAIGHSCREATQLFLSAVVARYDVEADPDQAKTVARLRAVLSVRKTSDIFAEHLVALLAYAGTLFDLVQRQEHGALKEGQALLWEDGRRVVFLTLVLLTEIDRAIQ